MERTTVETDGHSQLAIKEVKDLTNKAENCLGAYVQFAIDEAKRAFLGEDEDRLGEAEGERPQVREVEAEERRRRGEARNE